MAQFVCTPTPIPFSFQGYSFSKAPTENYSDIISPKDFHEILESFKLNKNISWISDVISLGDEKLSELIFDFCAFPRGQKGIELAKKISIHPFKTNFQWENPNLWQTIVKIPVQLTEKFLLSFSGSKLRELSTLIEETSRAKKEISIEPTVNFENLRTELFKIRFEKTFEQRQKNLAESKTLPQPWKLNFVGQTDEQTLELKATIKDKVDLERAKSMFERNFSKLEEIVSNLT